MFRNTSRFQPKLEALEDRFAPTTLTGTLPANPASSATGTGTVVITPGSAASVSGTLTNHGTTVTVPHS